MNGIKGYISIREASYRWGVSERRVNQYCAEGRISCAARLGVHGRSRKTRKSRPTRAGKPRKEAVDMISDKTAYRRYLDGEEKAADLLVERYGDALTLYINGYIKDIHEAEDLMIEAFSQLFAKERPIEGEGSFKAYLYKIARHLALRHKQKHRLVFLCLEELDFEPRSDSLAETAMLRSERDRQLYDALEKLKAEYREALYLVYFEDMSYRNAATVMNKSESQITKLVYRGKQSLKVILEQEGFTYADK